MIEVKEEYFIAEGGLQACYAHPKNQNLCIKINTKSIKSDKLDYEIKYTKKISKRKYKNLEYLFFSKFHEEIQTNLGVGYVYDLIRDEDTGKVSKTMADYLLDKNSKINDVKLREAFDILVKMMMKHRVIANDLRPNNICCKILNNGSIEMIIIDGLGHKDLIPLVEWFNFFNTKKLKRRLIRHEFDDFEKQRELLTRQGFGNKDT